MMNFKAKTPKSNASRRFFDMFMWVSIIFSAVSVVSVMVMSMVNDALALYKPSKAVEISASDLNELVACLDNEGIVDHPWLFYAYATIDGASDFGEVKSVGVNSSMDYRQILASFKKNSKESVKRITFPSGATTDQIIDIFVENGMGSREGFVRVINTYPFEYDFVKILDKKTSPYRKYRLDGYLYPDTYDFYMDRSEEYYIYKLLDRFESAVKGINAYSIDEAVIIASMIQSSSSQVGQYEYLSAVFHNRLNDQDRFPFLECPATNAYGYGGGGEVFTGLPGEEVKKIDSPYNTFLNKGLPPGAVCNPGINAIICAIRPARSDYKYFVTLKNGEALFARNEEEHRKNLIKVDG